MLKLSRWLVVVGLAALSLYFAGSRFLGASESHAAATPTASGFAGNVEMHSKRLEAGEEIVQIIDNDHSIVCYGKVSQGGASSLSCQRSK